MFKCAECGEEIIIRHESVTLDFQIRGEVGSLTFVPECGSVAEAAQEAEGESGLYCPGCGDFVRLEDEKIADPEDLPALISDGQIKVG